LTHNVDIVQKADQLFGMSALILSVLIESIQVFEVCFAFHLCYLL